MGPPSVWLFIWTSQQGQWNSHRGPGPADLLQLAHRSQISGLLEWLFSWMEKNIKRGRAIEKASPFFPFPFESHSIFSSFLLLANSIPLQSPGDCSENASSYYITYAVHQSDRVWITPSMTPKSWRYQTPGLHGRAVTTSGCLEWDREPLGGLDWVELLSTSSNII